MSRTYALRHIFFLLLFLTASSVVPLSEAAGGKHLIVSRMLPLLAEGAISQYVDPENGIEEGDEDPDVIINHTEDGDVILKGDALKKPEPNDTNRNWWYLLKHRKLNTADTTVRYPRFLGFCMKVYRWADKAFNSYDTAYVVGTGKRWKARILSDNWLDSYYINPGKKIPVRMMSDPYCNVGGYIQYMAVSIGYSVDINNLFGNNPANHKKFEYTFNCARFNIEGHLWKNTGGTYIRTFGEYNDGKLVKRFFDGVKLQDFEVFGYYFFNNRKFSMGAAYNFSKFQRKSAGTAVVGIGYNNLDISIDMNKLPEELKPFLQVSPENYKFHYRSYSVISGYSFNWVLSRKLLFNISAFPGVGLNLTYADNHYGSAKTWAMNIKALGSLTYNLNDFFICAVAKLYGNWYISGKNTLFSSVENAQLSVGIRF